MATNDIMICSRFPLKLVMQLDKLALHAGMSRAKFMNRIVSEYLKQLGERIETSSVADGETHDNGVSKTVILGMRDLL